MLREYRRDYIKTAGVLALILLPVAVHAQDAAVPPPPPAASTTEQQAAPSTAAPGQPAAPSTPSTDQQQPPTYQGGVPQGPSTAPETPPPPPPARRYRLAYGINGGVFFPSSGKVANRFGGQWWSVGVALGGIPVAPNRGLIGLDLRTKYQSNSNDRHAFVGDLGLEYRHRFPTSESAVRSGTVPYYGASVDAVFVDVSSPEDNVQSGIDVVPGGSVFVGTSIQHQEFATLRYEFQPDVKGFNFSGVGLTVGVRFF